MNRGKLMRWFRSLGRIRAEVDEEIEFHLECRTAELERTGLSRPEARREALDRFGDVDRTREVCVEIDRRKSRAMRRREVLAEVLQDLVHGARHLRRRPAFAAAAITTLAVGIGANTAVFSAADHILLRPLPFVDADEAVTLWETNRSTGERKKPVSPGNYLEWRERAESFESMGLAEPFGFDLTDPGGPPIAVRVWLVSEGWFEALGVRPLLGRTFTPDEHIRVDVTEEDDDAYGIGAPVVLISHRLWQSRYGGDPGVVGRTISLDGMAMVVVGVLPPELEYPDRRDIWAPKWFAAHDRESRSSGWMHAVGRLRPGVTVAQAQADMDRVARTLASEYPSSNGNAGVNVVPLSEQILGPVRPALMVLLGAVALVLLIACANVASLLLARAGEREEELGVRAALGAGRGRLARQLITESALLAFLGGAAGVAVAWIGVRVLGALAPADLPRVETMGIDGRVLGFALLVTGLTAVLFGLAPTLRFSRPDLARALGGGGRRVVRGGNRPSLQGGLVIGEIALALILLIGAGLLGRSFADLLNVDPGFVVERRASVQVFLWDRNPTGEGRLQTAEAMRTRIEALPNVDAVGIVTALPFHPTQVDPESPVRVEDREPPPGGQDPRAYTTIASPEYFRVMGIPLVQGRMFTPQDRAGAPLVAVINETLARRLFAGADPVGERVTVGVMSRPVTWEVVGVVGDVRPTALDADPRPEIYVPYAQTGTGAVTFVARTTTEAAATLPAMREAIWSVDPGQAIYHAGTLEEMVAETLVERRFHLVLLAFFSATALILAAVGIYGLITYWTGQRAHEIGVRLALGAERGRVVGMIVRQGLRLGVPGVVLGVIGALALTRFMAHMLYGVAPTDAVTFLQLAVVMLAVTAVAAYVPARRAASLDPARTLRYE